MSKNSTKRPPKAGSSAKQNGLGKSERGASAKQAPESHRTQTHSSPLKPPKGEEGSIASRNGNGHGRWTFLTNHAHVLALVQSDPEIILREMAVKIGITERAVQRIVHELVEDDYLVVEKVGRRNRYTINVKKSLRHPIESHRTIGDVLELIRR